MLVLVSLIALPRALIHGQETPQLTRFVIGAANPELISDAAVFTALAGLLKQCEYGINSQFCLQIDGVDMNKALRLAQEYSALVDEQSAARHAVFCATQRARRVPYLSAAEFGLELSGYMDESSRLEAVIFVTKGTEILGIEGMQNLMRFANGDFRNSLQEGKLDYVAMAENSHLAPEQLLEQFCVISDAPGGFRNAPQ